MKFASTLLMMAALLMFSACDKPADAPKTEEPAAEPAAETEPAAPTKATESAPAEAAKAEMVEVTAEGTTFKPPVQVAQIPDGAWYCDMGTVEYARTEKGDGKCPVCGMMLKQKGAAAADDGHGHDHDHDGEGHDGHEH